MKINIDMNSNIKMKWTVTNIQSNYNKTAMNLDDNTNLKATTNIKTAILGKDSICNYK